MSGPGAEREGDLFRSSKLSARKTLSHLCPKQTQNSGAAGRSDLHLVSWSSSKVSLVLLTAFYHFEVLLGGRPCNWALYKLLCVLGRLLQRSNICSWQTSKRITISYLM